MSDKTKDNRELSGDVGEKIATVFQSYAVNPIMESIGRDINTLDKKIFGEEKLDYSLREEIKDNNEALSSSLAFVSESVEKKSEEICKSIAEFSNKIEETFSQKEENICKQISSVPEETVKKFDDLKEQIRGDIKGLEEKTSKITTDCSNTLREQLRHHNEQLQNNQTSLLSAICESCSELKTAINEFSKGISGKLEENQTSDQTAAENAKKELLEALRTQYNGMKKLIFGLLIANGLLLGLSVAVILLLIFR